MASRGITLPDLVIPNSTAVSNVIDKEVYRAADRFLIGAPATQPDTVTVEVSFDAGTSYHTLQSAGSDISLAAGKATVILAAGWDKMRLASSGNVAAERTFILKMIEVFK